MRRGVLVLGLAAQRFFAELALPVAQRPRVDPQPRRELVRRQVAVVPPLRSLRPLLACRHRPHLREGDRSHVERDAAGRIGRTDTARESGRCALCAHDVQPEQLAMALVAHRSGDPHRDARHSTVLAALLLPRAELNVRGGLRLERAEAATWSSSVFASSLSCDPRRSGGSARPSIVTATVRGRCSGNAGGLDAVPRAVEEPDVAPMQHLEARQRRLRVRHLDRPSLRTPDSRSWPQFRWARGNSCGRGRARSCERHGPRTQSRRRPVDKFAAPLKKTRALRRGVLPFATSLAGQSSKGDTVSERGERRTARAPDKRAAQRPRPARKKEQTLLDSQTTANYCRRPSGAQR